MLLIVLGVFGGAVAFGFIGLFVGLVLAGWDVLSSGLRDVLRWESLSGVLLAIVWPLIILALAAGHGAPPMPLGFGSLCYRLCWPGSRLASAIRNVLDKAIRGGAGKRLTYRQPRGAQQTTA